MGTPAKLIIKTFITFAVLSFTTLALADTSNKWRLEFSGNSESTGTIVIEITPKDAEAITVEINVAFDESENRVAKRAVTVLEAQLPDDVFHVERDDGEDILIKKRLGEENFGVRIVSNTVKGVRVDLEKE